MGEDFSNRILTSLSVLFLILLTLTCFWTINYLLYPTIILMVFWIFKKGYSETISICIPEIAIILLLILELIIVLLLSNYKPKTFQSVKELFIIVSTVLILKTFLSNNKYLLNSALFLSTLSFILTLFNVFFFFWRFYEAEYHGFSDFSQFRYLYTPMGFFSNEWVTILLTFLPFNLAILALLNKKEIIKSDFLKLPYVKFLGIIPMLIWLFNLFISFSRGGYLAFALLILILNVLLIIYRLIKIKTLIISNVFVIISITCMASFFFPTIKSTFVSSISHQRSTSGRIDQWKTTYNIVKDFPISGIGSGNYPLINTKYKQEKPDDSFTARVNNSYIQLVTEKGVLGFTAYLFLFLIFIFYSHRKIVTSKTNEDKFLHIIILSSVLVILVRELFFSSVFYNPGLLFLILILFSINTSGMGTVIKLSRNKYKILLTGCLIVIIFIVVKDYQYGKEKKQLVHLSALLNKEKFGKALEAIKNINIHNFNNSLLVSTCGLVYERNALDSTQTVSTLFQKNYSNFALLSKSIECYKLAIKQNPYEDVFYHNLAWLYHFEGKNDSALYNINKAVDILSNSSLYYLSKGIFLEKKQPSEAISCFKEVIKLSPDVTSSPLFIEITDRNMLNKDSLIYSAIADLEEYQNTNYSTIIQARIGKLLLDVGEIDSAKIIFENVLKELPNLNRPWYYLGYINELQNNEKEMLSCYNKAIFLDFDDYLPRRRLAYYYYDQADSTNGNYYKKTSLKYYENSKTESSAKAKGKYGQRITNDNLIPYGLCKYLKQ